MQKLFLFIALCLFCSKGFNQKYYVPLIKNDKVYLVNQKGKPALKQNFDAIFWKGGHFFLATNNYIYNDFLVIGDVAYKRENQRAETHSVIFKNKIIVEDIPHNRFEFLLNKLVVARREGFNNVNQNHIDKFNLSPRRSIALFNTKGENIYPNEFRTIQKIDTIGQSNKQKEKSKYILFVAVDHQDKYSLFAYDLDQERISDWIISNVSGIKFVNPDYQNKNILFEVTDSLFISEKVLFSYQNAVFKTERINFNKNNNREGHGINPRTVAKPELTYNSASSNYEVEKVINEPEKNFIPQTEKTSIQTFRFYGDTLFFLPDKYDAGVKSRVEVTNERVFLKKSHNDYSAVIFKENDKFGLLLPENEIINAKYDSIYYIGNHYFLVKQNGLKGILDSKLSELLPIEFDEISFGINDLVLSDEPNGKKRLIEKSKNSALTREQSFEVYLTTPIRVYKNNLMGFYDASFTELLVVEWQLFLQTDLHFTLPQKRVNFIAKKNDKFFAFTHLGEALGSTQNQTFDYFPVFYYPDYYGIKGFTMYGLYNEHFEFKGFVTNNGIKYYPQK
jgi:hypothetical protein